MSYLLTKEILQTARSKRVRLIEHTDRDQYKKWKCSTHGLFTRTIAGVRNGILPCPSCSEEHRREKMVKTKFEDRKIREREHTKILLSTHKHLSVVKANEDATVTFHCSKCSVDFTHHPSFLVRRRKYGCPTCGVRESSKNTIAVKRSAKYENNKTRIQRVEEKLKRYPLLRLLKTIEPEVGKIRFQVQCSECLKTTDRTEQNILGLPDHTTGCRRCSRVEIVSVAFRQDHDYVVSVLKTYKNLDLLGKPKTRDSVVKFKCLDCDHKFTSTTRKILDSIRKCPECKPKTWRPSRMGKRVSVSTMMYVDGHEFELRGTEEATLKHLLASGVKASDIKTNTFARNGGGIKIEYEFHGKRKNHYPDFYVESKDLVIESKSPFTLGIEGTDEESRILDMNRAKSRAAVEKGINYRVAVVTPKSSRVLFLPKKWYTMSTKSLRKKFNQRVLLS